MIYKTLNLVLDMGVKSSTNLSLKSVQFGDGYKQLYSFGINNKSQNWSGAKTGDYNSIIRPVEDFLDSLNGVIPFYWTSPKGEKKLYTCNNWSTSQNKANLWTISLEFEQFISV